MWIFCLQVSVGIFGWVWYNPKNIPGTILISICLPGIDHRHTNAKNVFVSLEFGIVAAI